MKRTLIPQKSSDFPEELAGFIRDSAVYDSSCSPEAKVLFIDKDGGYFLKTAGAGALEREARMTEYLHSLGLSAKVLHYGTAGERDWLLTERIPGEDCTDPRYTADPKRLCDTTAGLLRALHETDGSACPVQDRNRSYAEAVRKGFSGLHYEPELFRGLWEFPSFEEAKRAAKEGMPLLKREVLLHGDYCLPNVILDGWRFSGFIDVGNGGIGDRHIDVLWGIWTLNYNLGTTAYTGRFMDAYGRDRIEPEMLRMIAAMEMIGG